MSKSKYGTWTLNKPLIVPVCPYVDGRPRHPSPRAGALGPNGTGKASPAKQEFMFKGQGPSTRIQRFQAIIVAFQTPYHQNWILGPSAYWDSEGSQRFRSTNSGPYLEALKSLEVAP